MSDHGHDIADWQQWVMDRIRERPQHIKVEVSLTGLAEVAALLLSNHNLLKQVLESTTRMETKMSAMDDAITALQGSVTNLTTVDQSAIALIQGFSAQIQAAVDAALAAGATPAQLQSMTDLKTAVDSQDDALAAAVAAGTPAAPTARRNP